MVALLTTTDPDQLIILTWYRLSPVELRAQFLCTHTYFDSGKLSFATDGEYIL